MNIEDKIKVTKHNISVIAKSSQTFAEFEEHVLHDETITSLRPLRIIKILIQQYAAALE